jgi:hypothetical protein
VGEPVAQEGSPDLSKLAFWGEYFIVVLTAVAQILRVLENVVLAATQLILLSYFLLTNLGLTTTSPEIFDFG